MCHLELPNHNSGSYWNQINVLITWTARWNFISNRHSFFHTLGLLWFLSQNHIIPYLEGSHSGVEYDNCLTVHSKTYIIYDSWKGTESSWNFRVIQVGGHNHPGVLELFPFELAHELIGWDLPPALAYLSISSVPPSVTLGHWFHIDSQRNALGHPVTV